MRKCSKTKTAREGMIEVKIDSNGLNLKQKIVVKAFKSDGVDSSKKRRLFNHNDQHKTRN